VRRRARPANWDLLRLATRHRGPANAPVSHMRPAVTTQSCLLGLVFTALVAASCTNKRTADAAAPLTGRKWYAVDIDGRAAIPADTARRPWIQFLRDSRRVTGSTGCNRFAGPYAASGSSLAFGTMTMTRMACLDTAIEHQEAAFTVVLGVATMNFAISGDTLTLITASVHRTRLVR
jgi:heat shock protein HslJ